MGERDWRDRRDEERVGAAAVTAIGGTFASCHDCGRHRLMFDHGDLRVCLDCRDERRRAATHRVATGWLEAGAARLEREEGTDER